MQQGPQQPYGQGSVPPNTYPQQPGGYPPPGYPPQFQAPQPKKKRSPLMIIGGIVGGLLILCCVAALIVMATANKGTTTTTSTSSDSSTSSSSSSSSSSSGPAKVGDTITVDGVSCTVTSVKTIQGDEITQPKAGNEFLVVHVKIANKSSSEFAYSSFDFKVKSGSGNLTDPEIVPPSTYTANSTLDTGNLASGGSVEGDIIIQAPNGDHHAELTWQPSIFSSDTENAWNLGL